MRYVEDLSKVKPEDIEHVGGLSKFVCEKCKTENIGADGCKRCLVEETIAELNREDRFDDRIQKLTPHQRKVIDGILRILNTD